MVRHPLLDPHNILAWDMDGTLINGPNSRRFREYIKANPQKKHHIVTFRDQGWADQIPIELARYGVTVGMLAGIHACPQDLWASITLVRQQRTSDPVHLRKAEEYIHWKGLMAKSLGCTVLIDDMEEMVLPGCKLHGIAFVHSEHPAFGSGDDSDLMMEFEP